MNVPYSQPMQMLVDEHAVIVSVLDALEAVANKPETGEDFPQEFYEKAFDFFPMFADKCHHAKEEMHLFPMLEARGIPRDGGPIGRMLHEHDEGRSHIAAIHDALQRTRTGDTQARETVRREAQDYAALLREHIQKENEILFVMGDRVTSDADKQQLLQAFRGAEDDVLPPGTHDRYIALATELRAIAGL
jgi:hemerythrin-like domain-containing protein